MFVATTTPTPPTTLSARSRVSDATRAAGVLIHFVLGRAVEDQSRPGQSGETATLPFPLMARGLRERHAAGATVTDDFRYALGILLAGLRVTLSESAGPAAP
jgi:TetR/AcrR family tetracycline transcriptional repressor